MKGLKISVKQKGTLMENFLTKAREAIMRIDLSLYGQRGVDALRNATPVASGETANSWYYEIERGSNTTSIVWKNSHINDGVPIAVILQYGHGTGTGGYVQGIDYINPALKPIFDKISEDAWREVTQR